MFRDVSLDDKQIFLSMMRDFYSSPAVAHSVDAQHFEATFESLMNQSPFMRAFMIEDGETPAGYALLSFTYSNEFGGMFVMIEELYVSEAYRGKGLGRKFFAFLEKEYASAKQFRMEVRKDNERAIDLYRKLGFKPLAYMQMIKNI